MENIKATGQPVEVSLDEMVEGMIINEYTGFSSRFDGLDQEACDWIKLNFKGATLLVVREEGEISITVDELGLDDTIKRIYKLPFALMNIRKVNDKLIAELGERGFTRFLVRFSPAVLPQQKKRILANKTNEYISQVQDGVHARDGAIEATEEFIDSMRERDSNINVINDFVTDIVDNGRADKIAAVMSLIANDHVYAHSVDVGVLFQQVYYAMIELEGRTSVFKDKKEAMLAAFLHDIGKSKLPKDIIDSKAVFSRDGEEMKIIRQHPTLGAEILESMGMPDYVINMARYHHVKLDTTMQSSYPPEASREDAIFETRLLALIDVYQALVSGRSYKTSWTPPAVMRYLDAISGVEFEEDLWNNFLKVVGHYPIGSIVKLSDGSIGFVVMVPEDNQTRPLVAVVMDSGGNELSEHILVDLEDERELSIVKDVDKQEIFQEKALDAFTGIKIP